MELMNTRNAAQYIGVAPKTLEWWRYTGAGPRYVKMGSLVRYKRAEIDAWIESRVRQSTSDQGATIAPKG